MTKKLRSGYKISESGCVGGYSRLARWITHLFNIFTAALLAIINLPIFVLVYLVLWCSQGRPIFYRGTRLGIHKKKFQMYKFRTLIKDADEQLEGELLGNRNELIVPTGKFLRDTKLDELPQLWNVLKRDMDLVGPRPVRPKVYEHSCKDIPDYEQRFTVRPGLIGISQLFTPHSTPKTIRSFIDNRLLKKKENILWNISALFLTGVLMIQSIIVLGMRILVHKIILQKVFRRYAEKRKHERVRHKQAWAYLQIENDQSNLKYLGEVVDINPEAFLLHSDLDLENYFPGVIKMGLQVQAHRPSRRSNKTKWVFCESRLYRKTQREDNTWDYVITYQPLSPLNFYLFHQYFLQESVG